MERQPWLERMNEELAGQGLPAGVRLRLLEELQDHLDDLTEGGAVVITGNELRLRMGVPDELAAHAGTEHRRATWVRRHPRLVFLLSPIPMVLIAIVLYTLAASAVAYCLLSDTGSGLEGELRSRLEGPASAFVFSIRFVPFLLVAAFFSRLAIRSQVRRWCLVASVGQIALLAGFATASLSWSDAPGQSQFSLGLIFPFSGWVQAAQLLVPLSVGALTMWLASRRRRVEVAM